MKIANVKDVLFVRRKPLNPICECKPLENFIETTEIQKNL